MHILGNGIQLAMQPYLNRGVAISSQYVLIQLSKARASQAKTDLSRPTESTRVVALTRRKVITVGCFFVQVTFRIIRPTFEKRSLGTPLLMSSIFES